MNHLQKGRQDLLKIFQAALARVEGRSVVHRVLEQNPVAPCSLVAIGKAAQSMALGAVGALGDGVIDGLVISKSGHLDATALNSHGLVGLEAGHPVPDHRSIEAGSALLRYLAKLPAGRPLLFLISGGASSLLEVLRDGVTLDSLRRVNGWLLGSGLSIHKMNQIRTALSLVKGGGLLRFVGEHPVTALMISDVAGDDPAVIGSGLLVPQAGQREALAAMELPGWLRSLITENGQDPTIPSRDISLRVVATLRDARIAAADRAAALGYEVHVSHAFVDAEAENAGRRLALELLDARPGVYVWGGEPRVLLPDRPGRGGRNQHLALAAAGVIEGTNDICLLSAGTDGTDGPGEDAGALVDGGTIGRGRRAGFDADRALAEADSGSLLEASGDLIHSGPTGTNVMDLILGIKLAKGPTDG